MDPIAVVRLETLPTLVTIVAPGAFVTTPFLWAGIRNASSLIPFVNQHEAIALAGVILLWLLAGFLVESLASYIEVYGIDRRRGNREEEQKTWGLFMRTAWTTEPVGARYLRRILVAFKFELNMAAASLLSIPERALVREYLPAGLPFWRLTVSFGVLAGVLFCLARDSAGVLADTRRLLMLGVGLPPFDANGNPSSPL